MIAMILLERYFQSLIIQPLDLCVRNLISIIGFISLDLFNAPGTILVCTRYV